MLDTLIIWALVVGIVCLIISGVLVAINLVNNKSSLIASITMVTFSIFFSFIGVCCIGSFLAVAVLAAFIDIGETLYLVATATASVAGVILGGGIAVRYSKKHQEMCNADPNCSLFLK